MSTKERMVPVKSVGTRGGWRKVSDGEQRRREWESEVGDACERLGDVGSTEDEVLWRGSIAVPLAEAEWKVIGAE